MNWLVLSVVVLWVVVLALLVTNLVIFRQLGIMLMGQARNAEQSGLPIGRLYPRHEWTTGDGSRVSLPPSDGRPLLVFFAGSTCTDCKEIVPFVAEAEAAGLATATMLFGGVPGSDADPNEFTGTRLLRGPIVPITQDDGHHYDVAGVPFAYVLDGAGRIVDKGLLRGRERVQEMAGRVGVRIDAVAIPVVGHNH